MKEFFCRDAGIKDCDYKATGKDEAEVLAKAEQHGRDAHGMTELSQELKDKVKGLIHEAKAA